MGENKFYLTFMRLVESIKKISEILTKTKKTVQI